MEQHIRGKVVCIDISQWQTRTAAIVNQRFAHGTSEEECALYPLQTLFLRVRNLMVKGGARYVVGVLDASKAKRSKLVRGNIGRHGGVSRRNRDGLNGRIVKLFKALGFKCVYARASIGEGEVCRCIYVFAQGFIFCLVIFVGNVCADPANSW